ncbi:myelin-oligodendrocyte glycoprotein-like isoform X2 [Dromiciops gliroides]|nr:myelin-oligodendrocyte glycoprotein-like isoform X2 [Dromiciops gliroides]XP_043832457.1 myelin-oligodendrocyte glycoprotein-like isoform X2 [Dromiciops gliroides]XP_043832458.1 myelin-oligodendrocyte glycoprotein-like isoform X2 [Dromiciops gliroides]XP_043832459.1 myelin-oligodendrocyte glycoprotein-like isoform X2 [Dromiciops gliroides]XP_043832460.1 myelin-oligodendrocyte glycoprotein-like isoform X2 [Dromiciops gliroides]
MEIVSSSGSFLPSFLIFLFLETYTLASEQFSVIGPTEPIRAQVGGEAALPCHLSPQKNAQHMKIIWFQSLEIVHQYEDGEDKFQDQSPDYQGRTELVRDAITTGNVTLRIWNITASDKGWYKCHFDSGSHQEEADVKLYVSGERDGQQMQPWLSIFTGIIIADWVLSFIFFEVFILRDRERVLQVLPWPWEINGILAVTSALEIDLAICYLWVLHRCGGLVYTEKWNWIDVLIWIIFLVYVVLSTVELGIELLFVICLFLLYMTTPSSSWATEKMDGTYHAVS